MSNGHTPGPWKIRSASNLQLPARNSVFCLEDEADGWNIGIVSTWENDKEDAVEAEANARLIAAAPELLEALEFILRRDGDDYRLDHQAHKIATDAIAKALGEG